MSFPDRSLKPQFVCEFSSYRSLFLDSLSFPVFINSLSKTKRSIKDDQWHHICATWENTAGSWNLSIDGALVGNGTNIKTGHVIKSNGIAILGQDQDNHGGGFEQVESFCGEMYGVNMWNKVLSSSEILEMSKNCSRGVGNFLRWYDFVTGLHGNVSIVTPTTCSP